jgi:hypothetical protein
MTENARDVAATSPPSRPQAPTIFAMIVMAALSLITQIILRRELAPGEFGTLIALLGLVLILLAPIAAVSRVLRYTFSATEFSPLLNRAALAWGALCIVFLFIALPTLGLSRTSLQFFTVVVVVAGLLAICARPVTPIRWCFGIGLAATIVRLIVSAWAGHVWPCAESGLGALVLACLIAGLPALGDQPAAPTLATAWKTLRPVLVPSLATLSVVTALALFTNGDRIVAQCLFAASNQTQVTQTDSGAAIASFVDHPPFDDYQSAGLLVRYCLWGLLPVLFLFHARRSPLKQTTYASLRPLWIYLAALVAALVLLIIAAPLANVLFSGTPSIFIPGFVGAGIALGLLQAIGIFSLASRRHVECFVLGACSLAYTAFLFGACRELQLLTTCMFAGALVSLMVVLFTGVVRYARSHP